MFSFVSQEILYNLGVLEGYRTLYLVSLATASHIVLLLIYFGFRLFTVAPYLFRGESLQGLLDQWSCAWDEYQLGLGFSWVGDGIRYKPEKRDL